MPLRRRRQEGPPPSSARSGCATGRPGSRPRHLPAAERSPARVDITRCGAAPARTRSPGHLTGTVRPEPLFEPGGPGRAAGMAHPPARPEPDRDRRLRAGRALGRAAPSGEVAPSPRSRRAGTGPPPSAHGTLIALHEPEDGRVVAPMEQIGLERHPGLE